MLKHKIIRDLITAMQTHARIRGALARDVDDPTRVTFDETLQALVRSDETFVQLTRTLLEVHAADLEGLEDLSAGYMDLADPKNLLALRRVVIRSGATIPRKDRKEVVLALLAADPELAHEMLGAHGVTDLEAYRRVDASSHAG